MTRRLVAVIALGACLAAACGCARSAPAKTRTFVVTGLPTCPKEGRFERPIVARIDAEPGLFEAPFSTQRALEASPRALADVDGGRLELTIPRRRMKATLRVGTCRPTSLSTWDCNAPAWMVDQEIEIDDGSVAMSVGVHVVAACASKP